MEYWSGWFDVWGEPHHIFHAEGMYGMCPFCSNHLTLRFPRHELSL